MAAVVGWGVYRDRGEDAVMCGSNCECACAGGGSVQSVRTSLLLYCNTEYSRFHTWNQLFLPPIEPRTPTCTLMTVNVIRFIHSQTIAHRAAHTAPHTAHRTPHTTFTTVTTTTLLCTWVVASWCFPIDAFSIRRDSRCSSHLGLWHNDSAWTRPPQRMSFACVATSSKMVVAKLFPSGTRMPPWSSANPSARFGNPGTRSMVLMERMTGMRGDVGDPW